MKEGEILAIIFFCGFFIIAPLIGVVGGLIIKRFMKPKQQEEIPEPQYAYLEAKVVDRRIFVGWKDIYLKRSYSEYYLTFETIESERLELLVPQEIFEKFSNGSAGTLALVNDTFFDFVPDEELPA